MLAPDKYFCALSLTQVVSVDLIVKNSEGKILVGKRKNRPAQNYYFVPGGRIYKNETIPKGIERLLEMELGVHGKKCSYNFMCISDHIYDDNFLGGVTEAKQSVGTHYVCIGIEVDLLGQYIDEKVFSDQHSDIKWLTTDELQNREDVHKNTKLYINNESWYRYARKY